MQLKAGFLSLVFCHGLFSHTLAGLLPNVVKLESGAEAGTLDFPDFGAMQKENSNRLEPEVLMPVQRVYPTHLLKRSETLEEALRKKTTLDLEFKSKPRENGGAIQTNVQIADVQHPLVNLDDIIPLVENVDIFKANSHAIVINFKNREQIKTAYKSWDWKPGTYDYFFLIVRTEPEEWMGKRTRTLPLGLYPFLVTEIIEKNQQLWLTASIVPWKTLGKIDFKMSRETNPGKEASKMYRHRPEHSVASQEPLSRRWSIHDLFSPSLDKHWALDIGTAKYLGKKFNIFKKTASASVKGVALSGEATVDCIDCYLAGKIGFQAVFRTDWGHIKEAYASISTHDVEANLAVEVKVSGTAKLPDINVRFATVPITPFTVLFITFGPAVSFNFRHKVKAEAELKIGASINAKIKNDKLVINLMEKAGNHSPDWTPEVTTDFYGAGKVTLNGATGIVAEIGVTAEAVGSGVGYGLDLWIPKVEYTIEGGFKASTKQFSLCPADKEEKRKKDKKRKNDKKEPKKETPTKDMKHARDLKTEGLLLPDISSLSEHEKMNLGIYAKGSATISIAAEFNPLRGFGALSWIKIPAWKPKWAKLKLASASFCVDKALISSPWGKDHKLEAPELPAKLASATNDNLNVPKWVDNKLPHKYGVFASMPLVSFGPKYFNITIGQITMARPLRMIQPTISQEQPTGGQYQTCRFWVFHEEKNKFVPFLGGYSTDLWIQSKAKTPKPSYNDVKTIYAIVGTGHNGGFCNSGDQYDMKYDMKGLNP